MSLHSKIKGVWALTLALGLTLGALGAGLAVYRWLARDHRYRELIELGDQLLSEGLPFQASRTYTSAVGVAPDHALAYVKRAEAERRQGNLAPAIQDLERASELSSDVLSMSVKLAELYDEDERFDDASTYYERALALDPTSFTLLYKLGLAHFRAGREAEAIEDLNRAAALRDGFWEAYYLRGAIFRSLGAIDEAEADFTRAVELATDAELARTALIELYLDRGESGKARFLVEQEIDQNPGNVDAYLRLADVHRLAGRLTEAIEAVGLALQQAPNSPEAYLRLGELWLQEASRRDDPVALEKAVAALASVVKMDPSNGAARLALGRAYLAAGEEARGFAELTRASQATPVSADAHRLLGDLYRARRNYAEAVTAYHVYLKLKGERESPAVVERLGDAYVEQGKPDMAAETFERLAEIEPRRVTPLVKAARAYLAAGDPEKAAAVCRRGLSVNPENAALLELLERARTTPPKTRRTASR